MNPTINNVNWIMYMFEYISDWTTSPPLIHPPNTTKALLAP